MPSIYTDEYLTGQLATRLVSGLNWQLNKAFKEIGLRIDNQDQIVSTNPDLDISTIPLFVAINNYRSALGEVIIKNVSIAALDRDKLALEGEIDDLTGEIGDKDLIIQSQLADMEQMTGYIIDVEDGVAELSAQIVLLSEVPSYVLPAGGWGAWAPPPG